MQLFFFRRGRLLFLMDVVMMVMKTEDWKDEYPVVTGMSRSISSTCLQNSGPKA